MFFFRIYIRNILISGAVTSDDLAGSNKPALNISSFQKTGKLLAQIEITTVDAKVKVNDKNSQSGCKKACS